MYEVMTNGEGEVDDELVKKAKLQFTMVAQLSKSSLAKVLSFANKHLKSLLEKFISHRNVLQMHAFLAAERPGLIGDEELPARMAKVLPIKLSKRGSAKIEMMVQTLVDFYFI